jgi:AcrR family transcriptional regulator
MARGRAADYEQQRLSIRQAAARLFAERGYPATSIADLARSCRVSKALVYHYYRDKEQLLFDVADGYLDRLQAIVAQADAGKLAPAPRLRALIESFMREYEHAGAQHRVLVQDVKYLSPAHRSHVRARQREVVDGFAAAIGAIVPRASATPRLKPLTMVLLGMMNWTFTWLRDDGPLSYDDVAQLVADLFLGGVGAATAGRHRPAPVRVAGRHSSRVTHAMIRASRRSADGPLPASATQPNHRRRGRQ